MFDFQAWSLLAIVALFAGATLVIATVGTYMTRTADRLADMTGLGEALFGAVLLGGSTSLPGIITSVTTAVQGYPELAVSNAVGGIAAQTTFLAVADMAYRGANLEHAAASVPNLMQGALLTVLLALPLMALSGPEVAWWGIHPLSFVLVGGYVAGQRLVKTARDVPLWEPTSTEETQPDEPDEPEADTKTLIKMGAVFVVSALVVGAAGYVVAQAGIALVERAGLSQTLVGGLFTAVATSLPELVTAIAAVRRGALTLAVGGIIGGNGFDVLFLAFADVGFRGGSIYHAVTNQQVYMVALALLLAGVLMLGLIRREKYGWGGIGFESVLVLGLYVGGFAWLMLG